MLNTLLFTVDNNHILKKINVSLGLLQLQSSILLVNTISLYHIVKCLLPYHIIQQFRKKLFLLLMPRSHIHGSPRRFYCGLNLTDDPENANFRCPIRMHYNCMMKYYYVCSTDAIRKATDQNGLPRMMPDCIRG